MLTISARIRSLALIHSLRQSDNARDYPPCAHRPQCNVARGGAPAYTASTQHRATSECARQTGGRQRMASVDDRGRRRVVVTGMGAVSPVGLTAAESWRAVVNGEG